MEIANVVELSRNVLKFEFLGHKFMTSLIFTRIFGIIYALVSFKYKLFKQAASVLCTHVFWAGGTDEV